MFARPSSSFLTVLALGSLLATAAGCAAEEPPAEEVSEAEEELRLFPDPRCRGPIEMSQRTYAALPGNYERQTAAVKQGQIWKALRDTPYEAGCRPSSGLFLTAFAAASTVPNLKVTLERSSDELPAGRRKMLHPFGAVATFDFVKDPSASSAGFTGVLDAKGPVVKGVMRASLGGDPNVLGFTPGVALKFLVDGRPSVNVVVMDSLMGQGGDKNFFRKPFTNELPEPHSGLSRNAGFLEWAKADAFALANNLLLIPALARGPEERTPNFLRVDHIARVTPDGNAVPEASRKAASHLVLRAPAWLVQWWDRPEHARVDYRDMLAALSAGTDLYEVYAKAGASSREVRVGTIKTTSQFMSSTWGDYRLFFRHNDHQNNADVGR